jgi:hypothetical protein
MRSMYWSQRCRIALGAVAMMLTWASADAQDKPPALIGGWVGTYTCPQGLTGLTVSINAQEGEAFSGYFHFYPPVANALAREGCYSVRGRIDGQRRITVEAVRWMTQPEGYVTVDLAGRLDSIAQSMTGTVVAPTSIGAACTTFELKAQVPAPRIAGICHAGVASAAGP